MKPLQLTLATLLLLTCIASGADVKITDFPASTGGLTAADIVGVVELSGTPTTKKATLTQLKAAMSLNNVQNTALTTWTGSTSLTTLGTISAGTWNGSAITSTYILDGTLVNADIASDAAIAVSKIAGLGTAAIKDTGSTPGTVPLFGTSTYFGAMLSMHSDGAGTVNVYPSEALASDVSLEWPSTSGVLQTTSDQISPARLSGAVSIAFGGTGRTSHTAYGVICGGTTSTNPQQSVVSVGTSGQVLTSNGAGALPTFQTISSGSGTVTSVGFTGGLISVATATSTPVLTVAGTSGGIPYFSSASTWASSAALAANALVIGGGAGAAPATTTTGTGVLTALGIAVGSSGAFVTNNAANTLSAALTLSAGTATTSTPPLAITQTWNGAGVTFVGPNIKITDTASAAASSLFRVQGGAAGATDKFAVTSDKTIITSPAASGRVLDLVSTNGTAYFTVGGGGALYFNDGANISGGDVRGAEVGNSSNYLAIGYDANDSVSYVAPSSNRIGLGASAASPTSRVWHGGGARHGTDTNTTVTATLSVAGPPGSGTGTGGSLILGYYAPTTTGSAIGTFTNRISLTGAGEILFSTKAAPSSASDTGTAGEIRIDASYIYVCTATNTWKRTAISTW